jgi:phage terminase small subunit
VTDAKTRTLANIQRDGQPVAGAELNNERAATHGAYGQSIAPRAAELRAELLELVPIVSDADQPAVTLLARVLARLERADEWIEEHGFFDRAGRVRPILKVLGGWETTAARLCDQLGLTPTARAKLGLNLTRARGAALREYVQEQYGGDG